MRSGSIASRKNLSRYHERSDVGAKIFEESSDAVKDEEGPATSASKSNFPLIFLTGRKG